MNLPPSSFNQFSAGTISAVKMTENMVVWIPYGWVTLMVNNVGEPGFPRTMVIPYLNAKLALGYPSIGLLIKFHIDHVKANQGKGAKYWTQHGDTYMEWLGNLDRHAGSPAIQDESQVNSVGQPALMDGHEDDGETMKEETEAAKAEN